METKRIGFIIPTLDGGGAERVLSLLTFGLRSNEKYLILFDGSKLAYKYNAKLIDLHSPAGKTFFEKLRKFMERYRKLKRVKQKLKLSIYISFMERANVLNILTKGSDKVIVSIRTSIFKEQNSIYGLLYKFLARILYPESSSIVVVSKEIKKDLERRFHFKQSKVKVIYNPYLIKNIYKKTLESLLEFKLIFRNLTLISVGNLTKAKGQWYLLRIFKELKNKFPDLKLVILGDGKLKSYLLSLSKGLGLRTWNVWENQTVSIDYDVYFLGFQKNPFKFISQSTLFVFPSLWEGFPNALVEAMACGVPVISSDCSSGPREILAPDTGILQKTKEPDIVKYGVLMPVMDGKLKKLNDPLTKEEKMWIDTLIEFLENKKKREYYRRESYKRAKDFDISKIIPQWESLILSLVKDSNV